MASNRGAFSYDTPLAPPNDPDLFISFFGPICKPPGHQQTSQVAATEPLRNESIPAATCEVFIHEKKEFTTAPGLSVR
jgi:hypothetical protein